MSSTNHTTNYNLPQFLGSDKPAWLGDINPAFSAIDTAMKANETSANTAGTDANTANTHIGTMENLETTEKNTLVGAVNEVNTKLGTVGNVASEASINANSALTKANDIEATLNFTKFKNYNTSDFILNNITNFSNGGFHVATNEDGTIAKIYGVLTFTISGASSSSITIHSDLRPETNINISGTVMMMSTSTGNWFEQDISIAPNGDITLNFPARLYNTNVRFQSFACVLFLKDFGD
jgi:hypothetical protein